MSRALRWYDYITVNIYYLGLTTLSQTNGLVFPLLVQQFIGETGKATFFGRLRLGTLMIALLVQAVMGLLSDRNSSRWGRRRPFIFTGTLLDLVFITAIGFSTGMQGDQGYIFLFAMAILLQISSNIAHSAQQGLIPDLIPDDKRGRFSGIKAALELPVPLLLVSFTIARLIGQNNLWGGLILAMAVLVVSMFLTMLVHEKPIAKPVETINWAPFLRLAAMTALFTLIILGMGEAINLTGDFVQSMPSTVVQATVLGIAGLAAMLLAVALGVWASIRFSLGEAARENPSFTWWVINRLAFLVGAINLSTFAVYFIQARLGFEREKAAQPASILLLIVGVFILISSMPSGWLADRFGHKRLVGLSGWTAAFGTLVALLLPNLTMIYIGGIFIGLATGIFFTANWSLGTSLVPRAEAGRYLGISNLAGAGAGAVGAYIGGPIADFFTLHVTEIPGLGYVLLFTIYGVLFLFSALALTRVKIS